MVNYLRIFFQKIWPHCECISLVGDSEIATGLQALREVRLPTGDQAFVFVLN